MPREIHHAIDALIRCEQADAMRHDLLHETLRSAFAGAFQHMRNDISFALDSADDRSFAGPCATSAATPLVPALVVVLTANPSLIDLDNATKLLFRLDKSGELPRLRTAIQATRDADISRSD